MKFTLTDYQASAVERTTHHILRAQSEFEDGTYSAVVLTAVTGAGKTVIATGVLEQLLEGGDYVDSPHPDTTILWVTSDPALNAQTLEKMEASSDRLNGLGRFRTITAGQGINQETFDPGSITFLNTQAASRTALISKKSDTQRYTIWETVANSVKRFGANFIVFIDEAHRGVEQKLDRDQSTVINKLVNGATPVPVIVGISATAGKFQKAIETAIEGEPRMARTVAVNVSDVQRSGIIKDRIVLQNPGASAAGTLDADTTLIRAGVQRVREFETAWAAYCKTEGEPPVVPAIVIQVQDKPTDEDLREIVDAVRDEWPGLTMRAFVNTFAEHQLIDLGNGRVIPYMQPHHIQDQSDVRVILAKNAITTGWDCPRAEVLVSLRTANDHTYIAQLIGRTIRQPLARRIESDETLNKVACYLPRFDNAGVVAVINQFKNEGDDSIPIDVVRATISYQQHTEAQEAFEFLASLPSYKIPSRISIPGTRRLHRLAAALSVDGVLHEATDEAKRLLNIELDAISARLGKDLETRREEIEQVKLGGVETTVSGDTFKLTTSVPLLKRDKNNVDDAFRKAGRTLKDGTAEDYWQYLVNNDPADVVHHKVTVAALGTLQDAADSLQEYANKLTSEWLRSHGKAISQLSEGRRNTYDAIRGGAKTPELISIATPQTIEEAIDVPGEKAADEAAAIAYARADRPNRLTRHIYTDGEDSDYYAPGLNQLERDVLGIELGENDFWYRNPPSGSRSLTIPYRLSDESWAGLHPDFILFRRASDGTLSASIVDPHGTHYDDAVPKLRGYAAYAQMHPSAFRSLLAIDRLNGVILAVPMHDSGVRGRVTALIEAGKTAKDVLKAEGVPL